MAALFSELLGAEHANARARAVQTTFMELRLGPALAAAGVTVAPRVRWVPLVSYNLPGA